MRRTSSRMRLSIAAGILLVVAAIVGSGPASAAGGAVIADPACVATPLNANDDGSSTTAPIGFTLNYFGQSFSQLFVNNNGNVTFDGALSTFTPFQLTTTGRKIIAPFFADVDTRGAGSDIVRYGFGQTVFDGHPAFCADWVNVGYFASHADKLNSFQLLLVDRSDVAAGDFDIVMNYDQIQWETGDASSGSGGLGGSSARMGFSDGVSRSFEQPASGTNGAFLDTNTVTGLIYGNHLSTVPGRYIFPVRNGQTTTGHQLSGTVTTTAGAPVQGAFVSACSQAGFCALSPTSSTGTYTLGGLPDDTFNMSVSPPGDLNSATATVAISGADVVRNFVLTGPTPPPPGTTIGPSRGASGGGLPVVYWTDPLTLSTHACPNASASYTITLDGSVVRSGPMTEGPAGTYTALVAAFYPLHGNAHVSITADCPTGPDETVIFDLYIDPSGTVKDTNGNPIAGATVTLLRSSSTSGPFSPVADGSAEMSPANRHNPDTSDANGHFGWDVIPGFYEVTASKDGCHAPGDPSTASVTTTALTIPPPVTDLVLVLECASAPPPDTTAPTINCGSADGNWHPDNVSIACTASDSASGLANAGDASFQLTTSVPSGTEDPNASTGSRQVCDNKGNCATAGPVGGNKVDRKGPGGSCQTPDSSWHPNNATWPCTVADGGSGLANADDASFLLETSVPVGTANPNAPTNSRNVCDAVGNCTQFGPLLGSHIDLEAPRLTVPAPITVTATSSGGAVVSFTVTVVDASGPGIVATCLPPSGFLFPVGTTQVRCLASDPAGNVGINAFNVTVNAQQADPAQMIVDLINKTARFLKLPALSTPLANQLKSVSTSLIQKKPKVACGTLDLYIVAIRLVPSKNLTAAQKDELIGDARRIKTVIHC